jgi:polyhydroxyalkanoate synthesis repressor PhaR
MTTTQTTKVIKRYANRKLYDVQESKYTTLKEIVGLVTAGQSVQIISHTTKADITDQTLLMALVETEQELTGQGSVVTEILKAGGLTKYVAGLKFPTL